MIEGIVKIPDDTQVMVAGFPLTLSGRVEVEFGWVDHGIGSYEYWGSVGYDSRMGPEDVGIIGLDLEDKLPEAVTETAVIAALNQKLCEDERFDSAICQGVSDFMQIADDDRY